MRYEIKRWNTLLTQVAPKQDEQASKATADPPLVIETKGAQTLQWHAVTQDCQDDNLCSCQDDLFLQNGSMHISFSNYEILKIQIANNNQMCIVLLDKDQCKLH